MIEPVKLQFEYKGKQFDFKIEPEGEDWWTACFQHGESFDVHYCEEYNSVSVYRIYEEDGELRTDHQNTVYSMKIDEEGFSFLYE
jgi:hypothetical protein